MMAGKTVLEPAASQFSTWFLTTKESFALPQFSWGVDPKPSDSKVVLNPGYTLESPGDLSNSTHALRFLYPGGEDLLEKEMATHSSTLAWKIP